MKQKFGSRVMALLLAVVLSFTLIVPETFATEIDDDDDYDIEIIDEPADDADDEDEIIQSDFFTVDTETGEVEDVDTDTALGIIEENDAQPINEPGDLVDIEDYDSTSDGWWDRYLEDRYGSDNCMADYWDYIYKDEFHENSDSNANAKSTSPLISTLNVSVPNQAKLTTKGYYIYYGGLGWSSHYFYIGGTTGYCVDPALYAPSNGTYNTSDSLISAVSTHTQAQVNEVVKIFYYSYGAPGYRASLWPSTDYQGNAISDDQIYVASHLLLADVFTYNASWALAKCTTSYSNWMKDNVIGHFDSSGNWDSAYDYTKTTRWRILVDEDDPSDTNFKVYMINYNNNDNTQILLGYVYTDTGHLDLQKTSGNTTITVDNPCYSLADAVYGVYSDSSLSNQVATLTTDTYGNTNTVTLDEGTYYVRELTPSKGYTLDTTTYTAVVTAGNTTTVQSVEPPGSDPLVLTITKEGYNVPANGGPSLAGARFEVLYFNDYYYSTASIPVKSYDTDGTANYYATNRWVLETKWDSITNKYTAQFDDEYLVAGSDSLYIVNGLPSVPYGTILIRESQAPDGYSNTGSWTVDGQALSGDEILVQFEADAGSHKVTLDYTRTDPIDIWGGVAVPKIDADRDYAVPQGDASLKDAEYTIYYNNSYDVVLNGKTYKKDDVAAKITTDEDGHASTGAYDLLYGSYYVLETKASKGYLLNTSFRFDFDITENGVIVNADGTVTGPEYPQRGGIGIYKYDVETYTMTDEPQGDADLANAQFTIRNVSAESVVVKGGLKGEGWETYEKGEDVMTISTDRYDTDDGAFYYAHTEERALPYGTYEIRETASPEGYLLGTKL